MKHALFTIAAVLLMAASGCATDDQYPVSGETCGPDDRVKTMSAPPCPDVPAL